MFDSFQGSRKALRGCGRCEDLGPHTKEASTGCGLLMSTE